MWETGIVAMPVVLLGSLVLSLYCVNLLIQCAEEYGGSFSEIAEAAYGSKMRTLTEILIICSQMAFCTNYVYFISSQMGSVMNCTRDMANPLTCSLSTAVYTDVQLWYFLPILLVVYVPLVWVRSLEKLAFTHLIGDVIIITVVTTIFVYGGMEFGETHEAMINSLVTKEFYKAIPYAAFAFEGVAVVLPLRDIV